MAEIIVITSGKGGVGKTTITANIGTALAAMDKKVILIDGDTGLRNLDVLMGLENRIVFNLVDVVEGKCELEQALIKDKRYEKLFLLPTAQTRDKEDIKTEQMLSLIDELRDQCDYMLIDCPAGIEQGFENSVVGADKAIIVVNPEITSIRDADRVIGKLKKKAFSDIKLVVNRIDYEMVKNGDMLDVEDIISNLEIKLLGVVESDKRITISTNRGEPIVLNEDAEVGQAFKEIAMRIAGIEVPFRSFEGNNNVFIDKLKKLFSVK
ncbi:septum site-determining protein MinD [Clostridium thailandense]|uniref:septum site-determining protein MinD n=1 Tax=Clostridium thailandense TaxID=2794346 RepID=UPI0039891E20